MFCPKCGNQSSDSAKFCMTCGNVLPQPNGQPQPAGLAAGEPAEELYRAVIGPSNQGYYLSRFSRFDKSGGAGVSWNWPAFFVTFYWLLYRKMWLSALLYLILPNLVFFLIGVVGSLAGTSANALTGVASLVVLVALFVVPPMYANALYYRHCAKKIAEARAASPDLQRQLGELSGKGGTSNIALIIVFVFMAVFVLGILAAVAIPAYQDYTVRAQVAGGIAAGRSAAASVGNYYQQRQQVPTTLAQAGFAEQLPPVVKELGLNPQNGTLTVTMASGPISGKSFLLVPSLDEKKQVIWKCMTKDIPNKYMPQACRQQE